MYVMHHAFRRDLDRFTQAARFTPVEESKTWRALGERWARFAHELHSHHSKEDEAIWPLLFERVAEQGDEAARDVLTAMEQEHQQIDPLIERIEAALRVLSGDGASPATRQGLAKAFVDLREILDQHLAHEETDAIPMIQRYITAPEWAHLEATKLRGKPTLRQMLFMLPWAIDELPADARERLFAGAPAPLKLMVRIGQRGYHRLDQRAFRAR